MLDRVARLAWSVWSAVASEVIPIRPDDPESSTRLDLSAARWSMDAHGIPLREQLPIWGMVRMLHDVRWHPDRTTRGYCQAHAWDLDVDEPFSPECGRCLRMLGVG